MNDSDLVAGLRRRDPAAVAFLMESYVTSLWRGVYVRTHGDPHLAEDIVSESVLALFRTLAHPEQDVNSPMAWLRAVADHKLHDYFRAAARVQHLLDTAGPVFPQADETQPSNAQEQQERRAAIRKVMDSLPEQHRLILEWKYLERMSVRDIAQRMEITEKAAESILFRARREFRSHLNPAEDDDHEPARNNRSRPGVTKMTPDDLPQLTLSPHTLDHPTQGTQRR
ncbi:sigma-70 family RNA polymerase sigma factor [bacterium]|nr:sigma-70 family RNA polymerase sigma factor [bacterium]